MNWLNGKIKSAVLGFSLVMSTSGYADDLTLAQQPLFVGSAASPNMLFILDDSGSMKFGFMPDDLVNRISNGQSLSNVTCSDSVSFAGFSNLCALSTSGRRYLASSHLNKVYFNPDVTYMPPFKADGTRYSNASFSAAYANGYAETNPVDLNTAYRALMSDYYYYAPYYWTERQCWQEYERRNGKRVLVEKCRDVNRSAYLSGFTLTPTGDAEAAFYYRRKDNCEDDYSDSCYDLVQPIPDAQKQNFANWFSYYRNRLMASQAGIGTAFNTLPENFRLGWGTLNYNSGNASSVDGATVRAVSQGVRPYTSTHKNSFFSWLYTVSADGGTPLRRALEGAGKYYEDSRRAWADNPDIEASENNPVRQCRQAYTILMTDGYYSGNNPSSSVAGADDTEGVEISNPVGASYKYSPSDPFKDDQGGRTLADVAMYYWKRDLRTDEDMDNYVPTSPKNPAFWQHMVTYGVGLGVSGSVDPDDAFDAIETGTAIDWWGGTSDQNKINDLLHAAVNSRGGFFSAADPETFASELVDTVAEIVAEAGSATAVEFDVSSFQEGAQIFSAQFDPNGWTGDIKAAKLGGEDTPEVPNMDEAIAAGNGWSAKQKLDNRDLSTNDRTIITYTDGDGKAFQWANLSNGQKADLKYGNANDTVAQQRLSYIRGDRSKEGEVGFRTRGSRLGSIVNSSPEYVGKPRAGWPDKDPFGDEDKRYAAFAESNASRAAVVYAGSNDGMLHGFNAAADGGDEVLAYIPAFVYSSGAGQGLHHLADPNYQHRYYVDLPTRQADVYIKGRRANNGNPTNDRDWRTILVGGGRAGAKGIFALDVTNPADFTEANAAKLVLWEFTAADDNRLGYILEPPVISLARWGEDDVRWTAFVSNGYNSTTATTGFFMLDIEAGLDGDWGDDDYRYIEFKSGGTGLSPLTVLDTVGDYIADRLYAGDLAGNLWVATSDANGSWSSAYSANAAPQPLFTGGQPITAAPAVAANKSKPRAGNMPNLLVFFGTGQYLQMDDVTSTTTQSVYGIWDHGVSGLDKDDLVARTMSQDTLQAGGSSYAVRYSTGDAINYDTVNGWYVDLPDTGERVVVSPQLRGQFLYLNSMVPSLDPCTAGGTGWMMAFGLDGKTPEKAAFLKFPQSVTGYKSKGLPNQSTILGNYRFTPDASGNVDLTEIPPMSGSVLGAGRRGWHELVE